MKLLTFVFGTLLMASSQAGAQTAAQTPVTSSGESASRPAGPLNVTPASVPATTYRIGPDDEISVVVVGDADLTKTYKVGADGSISIPYVKDAIIAKGLTALELRERIRTALLSLYTDPQVRVDVSKYGSQFVNINGEVRIPQRLPMTGPMQLLDALTFAGGPTTSAGTRVQITRPNPTGGDATRWEVGLAELTRGFVQVDLVGGDIINVPKAEVFYVQGQVKNTNSFIWEPGLTIDQAITKAGGLDERGLKSGLKVTRMVDGKSKTIDVKLTDPVKPNDTIIVKSRMF